MKFDLAEKVVENAKMQLRISKTFPYDAGKDFWDGYEPNTPPATDWAHAASRGVLAELSGRNGIRLGLGKVDHDTRAELTHNLAAIIRQAYADKKVEVSRLKKSSAWIMTAVFLLTLLQAIFIDNDWVMAFVAFSAAWFAWTVVWQR